MKRWLVIAVLAACGGESRKAAPDAGAAVVSAGSVGAVTAPGAARVGGAVVASVDDVRVVINREGLVDLAVEAPGYDAMMTVRGLKLGRVPDGSIARQVGLAAGDVIVQLDGKPLRAMQDVQDGWLALRRDGALAFMVERGGARTERKAFLSEVIGSSAPSTTDPLEVALLDAMRTGVRPGDPGEIDPAVLAALADPALVDSLARATYRPSIGLEPTDGSAIAALGVTRWDVIKAVGAVDVSTATSLGIELGRATSELQVVITRVTDPMVLRFKVVPGLADQAALTAALEAWKAREAQLAADAAAAKAAYDSAVSTDWAKYVTSIDETHYVVTSELLALVSSDPLAISKGARVVPAIKNGKPDGFKLYAIRPNSLYAQLGLANGDTISAVNGHALDSPDAASAVYAKLRSAKKITLDVTRRGSPVQLEYKVK